MVSAPSTPVSATSPPPGSLVHGRWPGSTAGRNGVRLALAVPLVILAVVADRRGAGYPLNASLIARAEEVRAGGADLSAVDLAYPPLPTLVAIIFPSAIALSITGALGAAVGLHAIIERIVRRGTEPWLTAVIILGGAAVPAVWFGALGQLEVVLGLMFLTLAVGGFVRFAFNDDTAGGFTAGLALAAAFTCTAVTLVFALTLALAAPVLAAHRYRGRPFAIRATVAVICFPVVAAYLGWCFLAWRFAGATFGTLGRANPGLWKFPDGVFVGFLHAVGSGVAAALRTPVYIVIGVLLARRRPIAGAGYALPIAAIVVVRWIGLTFDDLDAFALLALVAGATVPFRIRGRAVLVLTVAAAAQLFVNLTWPPSAAGLDAWLARIF